MRNHLHQRTFHAQAVEHEKAQRHKAHVRDGRIGHQLFHVFLHQRHQADIDHGNQRQANHERRKGNRGIGRDRQRETQKAIRAQFQRNGRQHHRAARGRFNVGIRQPGMHRPHRNLHRKAKQEAEENPHLLGRVQRQLVPDENGERAGLAVQINQRQQHRQRTGQRVEEKLDGGIDAVWPAPDADNQIQWNQRGFKEYVEQHAIERGENAVHQAGHNQEGGHVLRHVILNHPPSGDHHQHGNQGIEQYEQHRNAIDAEVIADHETLNPARLFDKLHPRREAVELEKQRQGDGKAQHCDQQREFAHGAVVLQFAICREKKDSPQNGNPDGQAQKGKLRRGGHVQRFHFSIRSASVVVLSAHGITAATGRTGRQSCRKRIGRGGRFAAGACHGQPSPPVWPSH